MTVFLDEVSQRDVYMELVWVRVFPIDLQLVDCLAADLVVLLFKYKNKSENAFEKLNLVRPVAHLVECCILPQECPQYTEVSLTAPPSNPEITGLDME